VPRKPEVRYFESRSAFYCQHRGRQHKLAAGPDDSKEQGPVYLAALESFRLLLAGEVEAPGQEKTVAAVWDAYKSFLGSRRSRSTLRIRAEGWVPFAARFGTEPVKRLTHAIVYGWLDDMRKKRKHANTGHDTTWTDGSVRNAVDSLQAGMNWAVKSGLISRNPLKGMEKPGANSRGEDAVLESWEIKTILDSCQGHFRDYCVVLEATGARPSEIASATARHFDETRRALVHRAKPKKDTDRKHKTAHKTGKDRVIYLTGEALKIVETRVRQFPSGPLFGAVPRRKPGWPAGILRQWSETDIVRLFQLVRSRTGIDATAYSFRHTFATRWLVAGRSVEVLAELLGTSPAVILRHYSHLSRFSNKLRSELEEFRVGECVSRGETVNFVAPNGHNVAVGPMD